LDGLRGIPRFVRQVVANYIDHGCSISAAAISYYTLLTFVPLILAAIAGLGFVLGSSESAFRSVIDSVAHIAPGSRRTIDDILTTVIHQKSGVGLIALISLLWTGSAVFGILERAMDTAWDVKQRRSMIRSRIRCIVLVLLSGFTLLLSTLLASVANLRPEGLGNIGLGILARIPGFWRHVALAVQFVLSACALTLLIAVVPNRRIPARCAIRGGLLTASLWELSKHLFAQYLTRFAPYSGTYGPIGGVIALVVWVYYSAAIVLFGSEASALMACEPASSARQFDRVETAPPPGLSAVRP
jgi:membrane protein